MKDEILMGEESYEKIKSLRKVSIDGLNWRTFYIGKLTGVKWMKDYPYSEGHGGGPPRLISIEKFPGSNQTHGSRPNVDNLKGQ